MSGGEESSKDFVVPRLPDKIDLSSCHTVSLTIFLVIFFHNSKVHTDSVSGNEGTVDALTASLGLENFNVT